jgi:hypothetical protein
MATSGTYPYQAVGIFACPADEGIPKAIGGTAPIPEWKRDGCSYEYFADDQCDYRVSNKPIGMTGLAPTINGAKQGAPFSAIIAPTKKAMVSVIWNWHYNGKGDDMAHAQRTTLFSDGHAGLVSYKIHIEGRIAKLNSWHP